MIKSTFYLLSFLLPTIGMSQEFDIYELPGDSTLIKANFKVIHSSVQWLFTSNWNSRHNCYHMELKSESLSDFISINFIARKRFYQGIDPLIEKLPVLKNILYKSYPYKYAEMHNGIALRLDFVKTESLSDYAIKNLTKQLELSGHENTLPDFNNAISVVTFDEDTWHYWVILENGDSLLWYFKGNKVLGLDMNIIKTVDIYSYPTSFQIFTPEGKLIN